MIRVHAKVFEGEGIYGVEFPEPISAGRAIAKTASVLDIPDPGSLEIRAGGEAILDRDSRLEVGDFELHYEDGRILVK